MQRMLRSIFKLFILFIVIALSCFVSALLTIFDLWMVAIFTSIGFAVVGVATVGSMLDEKKRGVGVILFITLILLGGGGFMTLAKIDHPLWSIQASGITLEEAKDHPHATVFYFKNGQVRPDMMESADIMGASAKEKPYRIDKAYVVPIVEEDWTPDYPVRVWGVSTRENYAEQSSNWKNSVHAGVRTVGVNVTDYQEAIRLAKSVHNLVLKGEPLLIELSSQPEDLVVATWVRLGWIVGIDFFFTLMVVIVGIVVQNFLGEKKGESYQSSRGRHLKS